MFAISSPDEFPVKITYYQLYSYRHWLYVEVSLSTSGGVSTGMVTILFPEFRMQPYNRKSREHNIIYTYMDTKGRMCPHLHSTNKTKNASN